MLVLHGNENNIFFYMKFMQKKNIYNFSGSSSDDTLIIATRAPSAIQCISWNPQQVNATKTSVLNRLGIMENEETEQVSSILYDKFMNVSVWLSNEGRGYFVQNNSSLSNQRRASVNSSNGSPSKSITSPSAPTFEKQNYWAGLCFHKEHKATAVSINSKFSLIAVGTENGLVYVYSAQNYSSTPVLSHTLALTSWASQSSNAQDNSVESLEWTSDGYAIAVGFKRRGLAVWSVYGGLLCSSSEMDDVFDGEK